ncbi:helix-turn-helix domain-containing protein [Albirhodobacter sp. R86504]|uniref:helix-turn-helix domain-containing protein n=1 Tax=Albirhodobacter sp. R86504 TaxID=3093848 RepID=UPI0036709187
MTKLAAYLLAENIRQADFARMVQASQPTISKLMSGSALPSLVLAISIERVTAGAVKASDWLADVEVKEAS